MKTIGSNIDLVTLKLAKKNCVSRDQLEKVGCRHQALKLTSFEPYIDLITSKFTKKYLLRDWLENLEIFLEFEIQQKI